LGLNLDPSKTLVKNGVVRNEIKYNLSNSYQVNGEPLQSSLIDLAQVPHGPFRTDCEFAALDVALQVHHHGGQLGLEERQKLKYKARI